jgi:hypothetical protein
MDGWMDGWKEGWMDGRRDGWLTSLCPFVIRFTLTISYIYINVFLM